MVINTITILFIMVKNGFKTSSMNLCVCMCVCVCACMRACVCVCLSVCLSVCVWVGGWVGVGVGANIFVYLESIAGCMTYIHVYILGSYKRKHALPPFHLPQITDRSEAASAALESMEIKHGEPLVVQFAAP